MTELEFEKAEDGRLLLRAPGGAEYQLPVDDQVREAVRTAPLGAASALTPREIQDRLRRGLPAEEIAREAGTTVARIRRWESPILAERAAVVERARATRFARPPDGAVSGPLGQLVDTRLSAVGVRAEWDAWKAPDGTWTVQATHRDGFARWRYTGEKVTALDRAGEQLGWAVPRPHVVPAPVQEEEPRRAAAGERPRGRRASLPSWEAIVEGTQPPSAFPS